MKSSLLAVVCGLVLMAAVTAAAQENLMGLYLDDQATVNEVKDFSGQLSLYLVAINPYNQGRPVGAIMGFDGTLEFQESSDFALGISFPLDAINLGSITDWIVGYSAPLPVQGSATVLATLQVYTAGNPESNIYLAPPPDPSIDGFMALLDADDLYNPDTAGLVAMGPSSGDWLKPVFLVNSAGFETSTNWGTAKILFR